MIAALLAAAAVAGTLADHQARFVMERFDREQLLAFDEHFVPLGLSGQQTLIVTASPDAEGGPTVYATNIKLDCVFRKLRSVGEVLITTTAPPVEQPTQGAWASVDGNEPTNIQAVWKMGCQKVAVPKVWIETPLTPPPETWWASTTTRSSGGLFPRGSPELDPLPSTAS